MKTFAQIFLSVIKLCPDKDLDIVEAEAQQESITRIMEETKPVSQALAEINAKSENSPKQITGQTSMISEDYIDLTTSSDEEFSQVSVLREHYLVSFLYCFISDLM